MMSIRLITFGCRLNTYESEVIKSFLQKNDKFKDKDVVVFNSCTVTSEAENQLRQAIRKARKENPSSIIGVVGCAAQTNRITYEKMSEVDFVFGNREKMDGRNYECIGSTNKKSILVGNIFEVAEIAPQLVTGFENKARGFIQIQNGCDNHCTFCATRLARGRSVSIPAHRILEQVNKLVENGYREIVLTGVDVTDYGCRLDENINLGNLVKKILAETNLERLRISSMDIADVNDDLKDVLFNENRVMPHLHISLQSGDNTILRRMARRHNREQVIDFCAEIKRHRKNIAIGADLIAGFPTETEEMHKNSYRLMEEIGLVFGHIFPYSVREGTAAATMEQVPVETRRRRARELRELAEKQLVTFRTEQMKLPHRILIESEKVGRTENYLAVELPQSSYRVGDVVDFAVP